MERVTGVEMAGKFSDFVNSSFSREREEFAYGVVSDHRTLQEDSFLTFLKCIDEWSKSYERGLYDERNRYTVKASNIMIKALMDAGLY